MNKGKTSLVDAQHDPAELEKARKMSPLEYYNTFIRIEGEKVLNQEEYNKHVAAVERFNKAHKPIYAIDVNAIQKYPLTPEEIQRLMAEQKIQLIDPMPTPTEELTREQVIEKYGDMLTEQQKQILYGTAGTQADEKEAEDKIHEQGS